MKFSLPPHIQDSFAAIIRALCLGLSARFTLPYAVPLPHPMFVAIHHVLSSRIRRFAALVARVRAGLVRKPSTTVRPTAAPRPRPPGQVLPRRRGWLLSVIPGAIAYASQLSHLLAQPDMAELIARAPTLGRLIRPLARMLAMDLPAALQRPPPPRRPRPKVEKPKPRPERTDYALPSRRPSIVIGHRRLPRIVFGPG